MLKGKATFLLLIFCAGCSMPEIVLEPTYIYITPDPTDEATPQPTAIPSPDPIVGHDGIILDVVYAINGFNRGNHFQVSFVAYNLTATRLEHVVCEFLISVDVAHNGILFPGEKLIKYFSDALVIEPRSFRIFYGPVIDFPAPEYFNNGEFVNCYVAGELVTASASPTF